MTALRGRVVDRIPVILSAVNGKVWFQALADTESVRWVVAGQSGAVVLSAVRVDPLDAPGMLLVGDGKGGVFAPEAITVHSAMAQIGPAHRGCDLLDRCWLGTPDRGAAATAVTRCRTDEQKLRYLASMYAAHFSAPELAG